MHFITISLIVSQRYDNHKVDVIVQSLSSTSIFPVLSHVSVLYSSTEIVYSTSRSGPRSGGVEVKNLESLQGGLIRDR